VRVLGTSGQSVRVVIEQDGTEKTLDGSPAGCGGPHANTEGIGPELAGVEANDRGFLKVNERLQTIAENVWAISEVAGSTLFTHTGLRDASVFQLPTFPK
jgi:pyruvate/2-oxoglutarate dehydrogenase complex dihydrolipoamide dehydrogenase (E3) component